MSNEVRTTRYTTKSNVETTRYFNSSYADVVEQVEQNTQDITNIETRLTTDETNISNNTINISNNTTDITDIKTRLTTDETNITDLQSQISNIPNNPYEGLYRFVYYVSSIYIAQVLSHPYFISIFPMLFVRSIFSRLSYRNCLYITNLSRFLYCFATVRAIYILLI